MSQTALDLSRVFTLEPHGPDTYLGESPPYAWGRIYGGLVIAQALWAATLTVDPTHRVHSLHAYFILGGDPREPVRYEVDRLRNGRSFTTRAVTARQSGGAILTLSCSFQVDEAGPETQSASFPSDATPPAPSALEWDAGVERCEIAVPADPPRALSWVRYPPPTPNDSHPLGDDPRLHACALAYLSDVNPMSAVGASHPEGPIAEEAYRDDFMSASLDHAMWFHRPTHVDDWLLLDMTGHGVIGSRGLATGLVFQSDGTHVATIAQEGLLRRRTR
ncbi:MAG: thioesterase family protein [Gammaproteobacteria bacterium]|nr:thioesterase family protein [Gammaproteobacteria bacterium]